MIIAAVFQHQEQIPPAPIFQRGEYLMPFITATRSLGRVLRSSIIIAAAFPPPLKKGDRGGFAFDSCKSKSKSSLPPFFKGGKASPLFKGGEH
jgi:hypothetical protein